MAKPKLLFLDDPLHERTRSADFFVEILKQEFEVVVDYLRTHPRDIEAAVELISSHSPEILVTWQVGLRAATLTRLKIPTVWVPMYDQSRRRWHQNYLDAAQAGVSVLAFSRRVAEFARSWNLPCLQARYFLPPSDYFNPETGNDRAFFWYRGEIQPSEVWPSISRIGGLSVVLKHDPDHAEAKSARVDGGMAEAISDVVEGFLPQADYLELVSSCGLFIAPRRKEGIGMSFLEALARGALVVGFDAPTMNEYLVHGETGWLFDEQSHPPIQSEEIARIRTKARAEAGAGHKAWIESLPEILRFVASAPAPSRRTSPKLLIAAPLAGVISSLTPLKKKIFDSKK